MGAQGAARADGVGGMGEGEKRWGAGKVWGKGVKGRRTGTPPKAALSGSLCIF